jgi:hypothetical protein
VGSYTNTKTDGRGEKLKFLKYWEVSEDKLDEGIERWGKYLEKMAKTPKKYPTYIFPPHFEKTMKGVSIIEADTEEQLLNYVAELWPPIKIKFVPLLPSSEFIPKYLKAKE